MRGRSSLFFVCLGVLFRVCMCFSHFFFLCMFLEIQLRPSLTPSPLSAEHACMCQARSRMVCKLRPSAISLARAAFIRSCLLANMSTGTPMSFSSANNSDNSFIIKCNCFPWNKFLFYIRQQILTSPVSSNRFLSELSITYILNIFIFKWECNRSAKYNIEGFGYFIIELILGK